MDWCQIITSSLFGIIVAAVGGFATYKTMVIRKELGIKD